MTTGTAPRADGRPSAALLFIGVVVIVGWQVGFALAADGLDDGFHVYFSGSTELAEYFLHLPNQWLAGSDAPRSFMLANRLLFSAALVSLYVGFLRAGYPGLGIVTVLLMGSNPFQLYEVNVVDNVFSWPISIGLLVLGLHVPMLVTRKVRRLWVLPACTGLVLGVANFVRTDALGISLSVVLLYLLGVAIAPLRRALMIVVLALAFFAVYFTPNAINLARTGEWQFDKNPHPLWNSIWCGLGDYDNKYGHLWDDLVVNAYGRPEYFAVSGDEKGHEWIPAYMDVLRDDVLRKITGDPAWYAGILGRRMWRIVGENTPPRLGVGTLRADLRLPPAAVGLLVLALFPGLVIRRDWTRLKLLCFLMPVAAVPLAVYSGDGAAYYSVIHLLAVAMALTWLGATLARVPRARTDGAR